MRRNKSLFVWACIASMCFCLLSACNESESDEVAERCTQDTDCATGETCLGGLCQTQSGTEPECIADLDCPVGKLCNTSTGLCVDLEDVVPDEPDCPEAEQCTGVDDCTNKGYVGYLCVLGCCVDPNADGDDPDGDNPDGDNPDGDQPADCTTTGCDDNYECNSETGRCDPSDDHCAVAGCPLKFSCDEVTGECSPAADHCSNVGCDELFDCNTETGVCEPSVENCTQAGCPNLFTCNPDTGRCDPGAEHCSTTLECQAPYVCNEQSGLCEAGPDHCSVTPCSSYFDCNAESGLCEPNATHCDTVGCDNHYTCNQATGECDADASHCSNAGCDELFACNQSSGDCEPGPGHCSFDGCSYSYLCNASTGTCAPDPSSCGGSCDGRPDQFCINDGPFLCECKSDYLYITDCEQDCYDEGYPFFDSCSYYTDSDTPSNSGYRCDCDNYASSDGTCASPIDIEEFPYKHYWDVIFAANALGYGGCTPAAGSYNPSGDGGEHVYRFEAEAGDVISIGIVNEMPFFGDPFATVRDTCGNNFTFCTIGNSSGTLGNDSFTVSIPSDGTYYLTVENTNALGVYTLNVSKN